MDLGGGGLVGAEGEIANEEGSGCAAGDGAAMEEHVVEGNREGGVVAVDDHSGGVADEEHVDAGRVDVGGGGVVVCGDDGDGIAAAVLLAEVGERDPATGGLGFGAAVHRALWHVAHQPPRKPPKHLSGGDSSLPTAEREQNGGIQRYALLCFKTLVHIGGESVFRCSRSWLMPIFSKSELAKLPVGRTDAIYTGPSQSITHYSVNGLTFVTILSFFFHGIKSQLYGGYKLG